MFKWSDNCSNCFAICSRLPGSVTDRPKAKASSGWYLHLSKEDDARIRSLHPVARVLPCNVGQYPLLLCRLVEDAGKTAPDPQLLLSAKEQERVLARSQLKMGIDEMLSGCDGKSVCSSNASSFVVSPPRHCAKAPLEAQNQNVYRRRPVATASQDALREQKARIRGARARAVCVPWWHTWLTDIDNIIGRASAPLQDSSRLHKEAARSLLQKTVPAHVRPAVWLWLAAGGAPERLKPEAYLKLASQEPEAPTGAFAEVRKQIEMDLNRTPHFLFNAGGQVNSNDSEPRHGFHLVASRKAAAKRLLIAYSRYCPAVGYCQGLNLIVAVLLSVLDEQSAFVVLCALLEKMPSGLHSADPDRLAEARQEDERKLLGALRVHQPALSEHLENIEFDTNFFLPRWLSCLFASVLDVDATVRLWDHVLGEEGDTAVSRLALAALEKMLPAFMDAPDFVEAAQVVAQVPVTCKTAVDVDEMLAESWTPSKFKEAIRSVASLNDADGHVSNMPASPEGALSPLRIQALSALLRDEDPDGEDSPRAHALSALLRDEQLAHEKLENHFRESPQVCKGAYLEGVKPCGLSMLPERALMYA
eukprot:TRINITY_DN25878_c0_g2_i3.p1 TRINITY_DN25878_c0_g2~~TRINITY_DN25878_c0_g2_i3.p1  ORF type:complete len:590 (+),score=96.41 TRINITY_DN25878_c0_g2_i3:62-1831(+)